jgi:SHS2 domain-containing protein
MGFTLQVKGPTLSELFEHAASEFYDHIIDPMEVGSALREKIMVEGTNPTVLLKEFITALIEMTRFQRMVFHEVKVQDMKTEGGACRLRAEAVGELIDPHRHRFLRTLVGLKVSDVKLSEGAKSFSAEIFL